MKKKTQRWQGRLNDAEYDRMAHEKRGHLKRLSDDEYLALWEKHTPNTTREEDAKNGIVGDV